jgi:hypothetical protein
MLIFERPIAGMIRYRRVFFPRHDQLIQLVEQLRAFDLLRVFSDHPASPSTIRPIARGKGLTTFVDLSKGQDAIYAGMHMNCRYKVRRAHKMRDRIDIVINTEMARSDFLALYNGFVRAKRKMPVLTSQRLNEYLPHADVFMLYFDGQPTCGRLVLRDLESRIALMLHSATKRLDPGADTITVGLLNRYLHWHEMKTYEAAGMEKYDFGGAGSATPSVTHFKRSFGGRLITFDYGFYAGTARTAWRFAHSLYTRWSGQTFDISIPSEEPLSDCFEDISTIG